MPTSTVNWLWIGNQTPIDPTPATNVTSMQLAFAGIAGRTLTGPGQIRPVAVSGTTTPAPGLPGQVFTAPFNPVSGFVSQFGFDSPTTPGTSVITGQVIVAMFRADVTVVRPDGSSTSQVATIIQMANGDLFLRPNAQFVDSWDGIDTLRSIIINSVSPFANNSVLNAAISFSPLIFEVEIPCFLSGTSIVTSAGSVPVERLQAGMKVLTRDNGFVPICWVGFIRFAAAEVLADERILPISIDRGALGDGYPVRDLCVSRQHRILVRSPIVLELFGEAEVLVAAKHLVGLDGIRVAKHTGDVSFCHILLDTHDLVFAEGALVESLYFGRMAIRALPPNAIAEIELLLANRNVHQDFSHHPVCTILTGKEARKLVKQHRDNKVGLFASIRSFDAVVL
jgi:uncharacterized radical SAM superfamily protein